MNTMTVLCILGPLDRQWHTLNEQHTRFCPPEGTRQVVYEVRKETSLGFPIAFPAGSLSYEDALCIIADVFTETDHLVVEDVDYESNSQRMPVYRTFNKDGGMVETVHIKGHQFTILRQSGRLYAHSNVVSRVAQQDAQVKET